MISRMVGQKEEIHFFILEIQKNNLFLNLKALNKNKLDSISFDKRVVFDINNLNNEYEDSNFIRHLSSTIEIILIDNCLNIIIKDMLSEDKIHINTIKLDLDLKLDLGSVVCQKEYFLNHSNQKYSFNDIAFQSANSVIKSLKEEVDLTTKKSTEEIEKLKKEEEIRILVGDDKIFSQRRKNILFLKRYLNIEQSKFIIDNLEDLANLKKEAINILFNMMFTFENSPNNLKYFIECKNGDNCPFHFNKHKECTFSHHPIQKRVFQFKENRQSIENNAQQNALLHLSILLSIPREELNKIAELGFTTIFNEDL